MSMKLLLQAHVLMLSQESDIQNRNAEKLELIKNAYWAAAELPRKKKKRERKILQEKYNLFYALGEYERTMFN